MNRKAVAIAGARGKMGQTIINLLVDDRELELAMAFERADHPDIGKEVIPGVKISPSPQRLDVHVDVLIDFTYADAALANLAWAKSVKAAAVIGTTGFSLEQRQEIEAISREIPVLLSPNMALGVNMMMEIVRYAASLLGPEYEVEIIETHHHSKKDAPSGTALALGDVICKVRGKNRQDTFRFGRSGKVGARTKEEIGFHSVRIGEIVGEHSVLFGASGEMLEITHRCYSRESFARGALEAAKFIIGRPPSLYGMEAVIRHLMETMHS